MASYRVMSWRGIPAQVAATDSSGASVSRQLPAFFQQEIDRVAMAEGLIETDDYLDGWAWSDPVERDGSAEEVAIRRSRSRSRPGDEPTSGRRATAATSALSSPDDPALLRATEMSPVRDAVGSRPSGIPAGAVEEDGLPSMASRTTDGSHSRSLAPPTASTYAVSRKPQRKPLRARTRVRPAAQARHRLPR
jgi:hypothetical protein